MPQTRRMVVLRAVVEDYIRSQEPVGSAALTKQHDLGVSSATVRNDMAALEEEGYLIQPHTSAGRVPTEKGYRYFVDRLATVVPLSKAQRRGIDGFLSGSASLQDTLQRAARLLARITGQVAVVASPSLARSTLRHVELVPVAAATLLAVVITDTGRVAQHTIVAPDMPSSELLGLFTDTVNAECAGLSLAQSAQRIRALGADPRFRETDALAGQLAAAFSAMHDDERGSELYMSGASSLAHQRTMADLAPLFDALEEQVVLMKLMSALSEETARGDGVGVAIGSETHTPGLLHAAVVTSGYGRTETGDETAHEDRSRKTEQTDGASASPGNDADDATAAVHGPGGEPVAFIGSIGPTHMDYANTISAVRAVARYLTAFLADGDTSRRDPPGRAADGSPTASGRPPR
ncbi:heat-inducible transcriptional repressor HrcA [Bifidobacterium stellenboschense]|uniref:Heat-inducible transcription repressor HrcA n=1 Tax=Bifidobacterium stellenboschense TaxID=762211 RepID=A0A087E0A7_9BIFI|nr:heat-inducible transcriptional repressor HrcA [Bifidobacterium stellenboschense]KFJ01208.1 HrcA family transcriptional regulator [Bifidobacterium stellenboschense]